LSSFTYNDDKYDKIQNSCDNIYKLRKAIPLFFKNVQFMKTIIAYSVTALFATALFIFWMNNPNMAKNSGFPVSMTIFLIGSIVCGYMPLFGTVVLNFRKRDK